MEIIMRVDTDSTNPALKSIIENPHQTITLDANFLIPPYRSRFTNIEIVFEKFAEVWLDPIFSAFPNLAIHEAVYSELVGTAPQSYINKKLSHIPPEIVVHKDSGLSEVEKILRDTIEARIASYTKYDPLLDNKDDRGEVKSLAYIAVKGLSYFAAHDNNAIQLIEKSSEWSTGLDNVRAIKMYELAYYLYKNNLGNKKALKMLYKYQYYLTAHEQNTNPEWGVFTRSMDNLYATCFK